MAHVGLLVPWVPWSPTTNRSRLLPGTFFNLFLGLISESCFALLDDFTKKPDYVVEKC